MRSGLLSTILTFIAFVSFAQIQHADHWTDSMMQSMSIDEKIGQLFIIRSNAKIDEAQNLKTQSLIRDYHIGGVCFFKGTIPALADLVNQFQSISRIPLMMSMDAEWGLGMRLTDGFSFPKQITLGAIDDNHLIYQMGREIANQMKDLGLHMNFAPVLDINNNICNPVINDRSFSANRLKVIAKSFAYMQGLQDGGVLACLKHFPGHGDTETDSHFDLPAILCDRRRLDSIELYPFKTILDFHPASVMVAHLNIPALDSTAKLPASLSQPIIQKLLRDEYNYQGLIITDGLEMKGITKNYSAAEIAVKAFKAGNDLLLLSEDVVSAISILKSSIASGEITEKQLDEKVRRILNAKYQAGLSVPKAIHVDSIWIKNTNLRSQILKQKLYQKAFTLARDENNLVPIRNIPSNIVYLNINGEAGNMFEQRILDYADVNAFSLNSISQLNENVSNTIREADLIIISLHQLNYSESRQYGLNIELIDSLNHLISRKPCIISIFGCPYSGVLFPRNCSLFMAYEDNELSMDLAAQMLFGTDPITGTSPVNTYDVLEEGKGIRRPSLLRLGFRFPETEGMNSDSLMQIDSVVSQMIKLKAAPGCQVVIAKNNKIIFRKSYGYFTYDSTLAVEDKTMYDLASLTKVVCSAPVLMMLDDQNRFETQKKISEYIPEFSNSNKSDLKFRDILLHQGKLVAWIPFYKSTMISPDTLNRIDYRYYGTVPSLRFSVPVCDNLYLRNDIRDSVFQRIIDSKRLDEKKYLYSDIGFYFVPKLVKRITNQGLEKFFRDNFMTPLGLRNTAFNPLSKQFSKEQIPPTEIDDYFRHKVIQGYVHDPGASMIGGISGHAGLFSNATEVATMMQMILNRGTYAGKEFFSPSIVAKYISRDAELSRRALVFDMPELIDSSTAYVSSLASKKTFGHQGFTGTCTWVDPDNQLVYVFLSNRTYPDSKINLLHKNRYRMKIQDVIYRSILRNGSYQ